jgi:hypothetical protein
MTTPHTIPDLAELEQSIASRIMSRLTVALVTSLVAVVVSLTTAAYTVGSLSSRVDGVSAALSAVEQSIRTQDERTRAFYASEWPRVVGVEATAREHDRTIGKVEARLDRIDGKLDEIQKAIGAVARKVSQ